MTSNEPVSDDNTTTDGEQTASPSHAVPNQAPDAPAQPAAPSDADLDGEGQLVAAKVRHAPRYGAFILSGAALGVLTALVLTLVLPADSAAVGFGSFAMVAVLLGFLTALLGALVAVLLDRRAPVPVARPLPLPPRPHESDGAPPAPTPGMTP